MIQLVLSSYQVKVPNYLSGVVSYGIIISKHADPNSVGVYTRVAAFTDWISEQTGLNTYQLDVIFLEKEFLTFFIFIQVN